MGSIQATRQHRLTAERDKASHRRSLAPAFEAMAKMLSASEYERMMREWEDGEREIVIENGYIVTCCPGGE